LAGLPERVVTRAEDVLRGLEESRESRGAEERGREGEGETQREGDTENSQLVSREELAVYDARAEMWREVLRQIADVDIANITPVQALNLLNEMQIKIKVGNDLID
jgi:DNA mismatch repair protein MutS